MKRPQSKTLVEIFAPMNDIPRTCPKCGFPLKQDERYVQFGSGQAPHYSLSVKLVAEWCPDTRCDITTVTLITNKTGKIP